MKSVDNDLEDLEHGFRNEILKEKDSNKVLLNKKDVEKLANHAQYASSEASEYICLSLFQALLLLGLSFSFILYVSFNKKEKNVEQLASGDGVPPPPEP